MAIDISSQIKQAQLAYVYPVHGSPNQTIENAFQHIYAACMSLNAHIYVVDDGMRDPAMEKLFAGKPNVLYLGLPEQRYLTRSWNTGAAAAFGNGADIAVIGNADAYPTSIRNLEILRQACDIARDSIFAVGPMTNAPGHIAQQKSSPVDNRRAKLLIEYDHTLLYKLDPVCNINGFSWAIHKQNYLKALELRNGVFLEGSPDKKLWLTDYGAVMTAWQGNPAVSMAQLGQEDELFIWANRRLNMPCGIAPYSFFQHDKGALYGA